MSAGNNGNKIPWVNMTAADFIQRWKDGKLKFNWLVANELKVADNGSKFGHPTCILEGDIKANVVITDTGPLISEWGIQQSSKSDDGEASSSSSSSSSEQASTSAPRARFEKRQPTSRTQKRNYNRDALKKLGQLGDAKPKIVTRISLVPQNKYEEKTKESIALLKEIVQIIYDDFFKFFEKNPTSLKRQSFDAKSHIEATQCHPCHPIMTEVPGSTTNALQPGIPRVALHIAIMSKEEVAKKFQEGRTTLYANEYGHVYSPKFVMRDQQGNPMTVNMWDFYGEKWLPILPKFRIGIEWIVGSAPYLTLFIHEAEIEKPIPINEEEQQLQKSFPKAASSGLTSLRSLIANEAGLVEEEEEEEEESGAGEGDSKRKAGKKRSAEEIENDPQDDDEDDGGDEGQGEGSGDDEEPPRKRQHVGGGESEGEGEGEGNGVVEEDQFQDAQYHEVSGIVGV